MEQAGHFAVDGLGHPRRFFHQLFGRFRIILRVGAQMLDKGFAAVRKPACLGNLDHLGADARDFFQADLVDLIGGQIGRGFFADSEVIIFGAAGLCRHSGCLGAGGFVAFDIPVELLFKRGVDDRLDRRNCLRGQRR